MRDEFWATASGTGTQERAKSAPQRHKISTSTSLDQPNATLCFLFCERCPDLGDRTTPITCQRKTILFTGWDRSHARATHWFLSSISSADRKCACSPLKRDIFLQLCVPMHFVYMQCSCTQQRHWCAVPHPLCTLRCWSRSLLQPSFLNHA